jgi:hypothetical protein
MSIVKGTSINLMKKIKSHGEDDDDDNDGIEDGG